MATSERNQITSLYHAALALPPADRAAFLTEACGGNPALQQEVESLLRVEGAEAFLEGPALAAAAPAISPIGQQVGSYRILAALGAGGMGEVYRARDSRLGRDVAIKMLPPQFTGDPERRTRFAREARVLATLNHPHIGAIYGLEEITGQTVLVLELVEGPTLAERLERGPMSVGEALAVARQVADALDAAHQKHIIHRDLKPSNIVLNKVGTISTDPGVKVLDFGLATMRIGDGADDPDRVSFTERGTEAGRILGTPAYMSPEQARGQTVDKRTDVWAFGCVLFEVLTGKSPFGGETVTDTLARLLEREPEWDLLPADTPASIRMLLHRCLRKDPEKRLRDIGDARMEIDDQDLLPATAPHHTTRRIPLFAWIAAAVLISGAFAAGAYLRVRPPSPAVDRAALTIEPPENARFFYRSGPVALAPDGSHLAVMAYTGYVARLWVRPFGTFEWRVIPATEGAVTPFWKPDSQEIGFFAKGMIKAVPVREGGVPYDICPAPGAMQFYAGATWNRDDVIVFMSADRRLHKVYAKGGAAPVPVTTLKDGDASHRWPSFLPDGHHFLYLALGQPGNPGELRLASLDGTDTAALGPSESNALYSQGHLLFVKGDRLVAQPFDTTARRATGDAFSLATTIELSPGLGRFADFSASQSGVVAYRAGKTQRLTWRDRSGRPVGTLWDQGEFFNLDLSPDGTRLAVSARMETQRNSDVWIINLATGNSYPLTTDPAQEYDPRWSPDGSSIAFLSNRTPGRWSAWRRPSNGSGKDEPLIPDDSTVSLCSWTPDGRSFLYTNQSENPSENFWVRPLDGGRQPHALRKTDGRKTTAVFSPDGHWIAYISEKTRRREVYVRAFPDGEVEHKVSQEGGMAPRWSADGKEIFFLSPDATMMSARVDTAGDFTASTPVALFPTGLQEFPNQFPYAVDRNGRFLMPVDALGPAPVTVLLNWQAKFPK